MNEQEEIIKKFDWDYLIILDACRVDEFEKYNNIKGKYKRVETPKGDTPAWCNYMFPDKYDISLYTANPIHDTYKKYIAKNHFKEVIEIWDKEWDEERKTVLPEKVYEYSKNANSKSIIWFLQPHLPAISLKDKDVWSINYDMFEKIENGEISEEKLKQIHFDNTEEVFPIVKNLVDYILNKNKDAKIIITSDHGDMLGEIYTIENGVPKKGWLHGLGNGDEPYAKYKPYFLYNVPLLKIGYDK